LKRSDLITVAQRGDYGKPRPAVVVQVDQVQGTDSILVCLLTSDLVSPTPFRVRVRADAETGLLSDSDIMADKVTITLRTKCGAVFGRVPDSAMTELNEALMFILGLDDP
jgi:mRNA interferase MazF